MIGKLLDKIESYHTWRFIIVLVLAEIIGAFYLFLYLVSILEK